MVNWDNPIEAVRDGGVVLAWVGGRPSDDNSLIAVQLQGGNEYWFSRADGGGGDSGWTIRNRLTNRNDQPEQFTPMSNPVVPNTVPIDRTLWERCVGLIRDLHADHIKHGAHDYLQDFVSRTAEIAKLLPIEVDADEELARQFWEQWVVDPNDMPTAQSAILFAIRKMREIERGGE